MRLLLVRHGETAAGSGVRYWGSTDVELSAEGLAQAGKLKQRLEHETIRAVYASNLKRAKLMADIITSGRSLNTIRCAELNEVNFGRMEGLTLEEIGRKYPELYKPWVNWDSDFEFPGGESIRDFHERVSRFADRLEAHDAQETVLVVAHAGSLRMLICYLLDLPLPHWRQIRLDLASLSIIEVLSQGAVLTRLNDVSHLA